MKKLSEREEQQRIYCWDRFDHMSEIFNLLDHIRKNDHTSTVIWLYNIGVEKYWSGVEDMVKDTKEDYLVNHMEEMNLLLTREQDYLILRKKPSDRLLQVMRELGFEIPHFLYPNVENEDKGIAELVLEDKELLQKLRDIAANDPNTYFVPYGVSFLEEEIAGKCNLHMIGSTSEQYKIVNNKIYSKKIAEELKYVIAPGYTCKNTDEIKEAYSKLKETFQQVIIKMPTNASGKGMWIIDNENRLKMVCAIIKRYIRTNANIEWIVEGWVEKKYDLNIQVYISEDGKVETFALNQQLLNGLVYSGSLYSNQFPQNLKELSYQCGNDIGSYLYHNGFTGIYGIDALITENNQIVPIEINGRLNQSTYLSVLPEYFEGKCIFVTYIRLQAKSNVTYDVLVDILKENELWYHDGKGILSYIAATMDSELASGNCRAFFAIVADRKEDIQNLRMRLEEAMTCIIS